MRRILILLLGVVALLWWLGRAIKAARGRPAAGPGNRPAPADRGGRMVRDRVCNTFLPASQAIRVEDEAGEHFFCSEACRDRFLAEQAKTGR